MKIIAVHLCCNHYRNGVFEGLLQAVEFTDDCEFLEVNASHDEGETMAYDHKAATFTVGGEVYKMHAHREWLGNWCWDGVAVSTKDAARLANQLKALRHWNCECATEEMFAKWNEADYCFTHDDFGPQPEPVTEHMTAISEPRDALEEMGM